MDAVVSNRAIHNHPVDTAEIKTQKFSSWLKTKAPETAHPLPTLYSQVVLQIVTDPNPDYAILADYLDGISAHIQTSELAHFFFCTLYYPFYAHTWEVATQPFLTIFRHF